MTLVIEDKDMKMIEEIAQNYKMSVGEFCRRISSQYRKKSERQFRVSEKEDEMISKKAEAKNMSKMRYCEYACSKFIEDGEMDGYFNGWRLQKDNRTKRIAVSFKDANVEKSILDIANEFNIEIGSLIRYCALNY